MTLTDLKDKRNKLMADAQKLLLKPTPETRSQFDAQMVDVDVLEADIERAERPAVDEVMLNHSRFKIPDK